MSADVIHAQKEPPVWIVHGVNFHVDVPLDEMNAQFDTETQVYEAASQALMVFKGKHESLFIVMDEGEEIPYLGTTLICHLKGTRPEKGVFPFTHIVLANQGFYEESRRMEQALNAEIEAEKETQIKEERERLEVRAQINNLKKDIKAVKDILDKPENP